MKLSRDYCPNFSRCAHSAKAQIIAGICNDCGTHVGEARRARVRDRAKGANVFVAMQRAYNGGGGFDL